MLRPPIVRHGNKFTILKKIIPLIPPHKIYIEPFLGSGALFFNTPNAELSILNDLSKDVITMFKLIKKAPLITKNYQGFTDVSEAREFYENHGNDIYDKIIYNLIKNNYGFYGHPVKKTEDIHKAYTNQYFINHLKDYKEKLKDTILLNEDYKKVIKKYDNEKAFIFLDPPYEKSDKRSYENPIIDYEEMAKILKNIKGKFLLTLNDSPYIRQVFKDFDITGLTVRSQGLKDKTGKIGYRKEVFIKNY